MDERSVEPIRPPRGSGFWGGALKVLIAGGVVYLLFMLITPLVAKRAAKRDGFFDPSTVVIKVDRPPPPPPAAKTKEEIEREATRIYPAGFEPYGEPAEYGYSRAIVTNFREEDAVVRLVKASPTGEFNIPGRNAFVPRNEVVTIEWVAAGRYVARLALGEDWDNERKLFTRPKGFLSTRPMEFSERPDRTFENGAYVDRMRGVEAEIVLDNMVFSGERFMIVDGFVFNR